MYLRDFLTLKPFHNYSLCSVCILPQSAFYSQSAVCILHSVCILPLVRSLQSAVRSLRFTLTDQKSIICMVNMNVYNVVGFLIHCLSHSKYSAEACPWYGHLKMYVILCFKTKPQIVKLQWMQCSKKTFDYYFCRRV